MRAFIAVLSVMAIAFTVQSCREGCKDKKAINYNSRAEVDNGTCLYCTSADSTGAATYFVTDFNAPSPYNTRSTFEFILTVTDSGYWGNGCQTENKSTTSVCGNYLRMVNLTNQTAEGTFDAFFNQNGFNVWDFDNNGQPIQVGALDTINFGFVDTGCSNLTTGVLSAEVDQLQFF